MKTEPRLKKLKEVNIFAYYNAVFLPRKWQLVQAELSVVPLVAASLQADVRISEILLEI